MVNCWIKHFLKKLNIELVDNHIVTTEKKLTIQNEDTLYSIRIIDLKDVTKPIKNISNIFYDDLETIVNYLAAKDSKA